MEIADVVVPELEVVDEVRSRTPMRRMGGGDVVGVCRLRGQHRVTHRSDVALEGLELATFVRMSCHVDRLRSPDERKLNTN